MKARICIQRGRITGSFLQDTLCTFCENIAEKYFASATHTRNSILMQMQDTHASSSPPLPPSLSPNSPSHSFASDSNLCFIPYISENCKIYILQGRLSAPAGIAHIKLLLLLENLNLLSLAINLNTQIDIHFKPSYQYLKRVSDTFRIKVKTYAVSIYKSEMWGKLTREHRHWPELINSNKTLWIYRATRDTNNDMSRSCPTVL